VRAVWKSSSAVEHASLPTGGRPGSTASGGRGSKQIWTNEIDVGDCPCQSVRDSAPADFIFIF
jgi:hypothetical protein